MSLLLAAGVPRGSLVNLFLVVKMLSGSYIEIVLMIYTASWSKEAEWVV